MRLWQPRSQNELPGFPLDINGGKWFVATMRNLKFAGLFSALFLLAWLASAGRAEVILGDAPQAPTSLAGLPGGGLRPKIVTGGFSVNTGSRELVRQFYNAIFTSSDGVPMSSTAVTTSCFPGTNSPTFVNVTLRRLNWFRALAGMSAAVTFDAPEGVKDQAAAVMLSEHGALQHTGSWVGWNCFSSNGTNATANSNLALGNAGPDAITAYVWDYGANNYEVGHRRWILYPQTQIMATGDVPALGTNLAANATWVFDANFGGVRPATRTPYITWPPVGYCPYQVIYPQWSFALSNANLSAATVTMKSNGVPVAITLQSYLTGFGENTLVWYPTGLNPATSTIFPFSGTDTVYAITVSNVVTTVGTKNYAYNVTAFDPATTGADYSPIVISGTNQPTVNVGNLYSCTLATNPAVTGYQWLTALATNGNLVDNAANGLLNFTISPAPIYPTITNAPTGGGNCFHLAHPNPVSQWLQFKELLFPTNNTTVSFKSLLGYATTNQFARVQASTDGGSTWTDIYTQAGTGGPGEAAFTQKNLSLASYAGKSTLLRFNYSFVTGGYFPQADNYVGWCIQNVVVTNALQLLNQATNATASTNFTFAPAAAGSYVLQARSVIFTEFPTDLGPTKQVAAVEAPPSLAIARLGNKTVVSWPTNVTGWTLQTNVNLATTNWGNYLGVISNNTLTNTPPPNTLFFRLKQ